LRLEEGESVAPGASVGLDGMGTGAGWDASISMEIILGSARRTSNVLASTEMARNGNAVYRRLTWTPALGREARRASTLLAMAFSRAASAALAALREVSASPGVMT